ncbi:putative RNA-directed DNA polymerase [Lupinus albus]|uniref:Putative RNA-directed DNA polymerase n=1 Tax=Lupinus albus TaxID=3870 RepID=A0A6A4PNT8_LUPAL|nr:putative RNA-directed DNA polymerase [Lupinus albus]
MTHEIDLVKHNLDSSFKIKDLSQLRYFLGLEVAHSSKGITLCQSKYTLDLLSDTGFLTSKPVPTPMVKGVPLSQNENILFHDPFLYRKLVGRLLYLTNTRPGISFVVQQLTQFMASPTINHHKALTRILRSLKGNPGQGLFYPADSPLHIKGFSDSDWATCPNTRKSISDYCMFL